MKYNLNLLLDSYDVPNQAKKLFYEIVKDYASGPDSVRVEDYDDYLRIYYAYQAIWCDLFVFKNTNGGYLLQYRDFVNGLTDIITLTADQRSFEIGAKHNSEYYAKRIKNLNKYNYYEALYYDESSLKHITEDKGNISSRAFAKKGLAPDITASIDILDSEDCEYEIKNNLNMLHNIDEIIDDVDNSLTSTRRYNAVRTRRNNYR